ncbi:hypothetical protein [Baileyella intestinalis]|uniref:hypothetical protein n=1 Tax=Baileyella intestinalis TaxID=2606709 RepID=UPI0022E40B1F|nr:hypothetical protein [Baileyella intestinalis]
MWTFIQYQIFGMKWLNVLISNILESSGIDTSTRIGASVLFFFYDTVKITLLLCILIFIISYIQSFFPPERSRKIMGRFRGIGANMVGALLGTILSFMMAVTTLSLPSLIMLNKVIKPKLMAVFVAVCIAGIIIVGYGFNVFQNLLI